MSLWYLKKRRGYRSFPTRVKAAPWPFVRFCQSREKTQYGALSSTLSACLPAESILCENFGDVICHTTTSFHQES